MKQLVLFLLLTVTALLNGQTSGPLSPFRSTPNPALAPFYHGVASGDPQADRVILWTRVTTDSLSVLVDWRVASDTGMTQILQTGQYITDANRDYTVKVDVSGLQPATTYYYEFSAYGRNSLRGRTRTLPAGTGVDSLRFAVVSCSNYAHGFFNGYERITSRNDIDAVLHLGDYIYEYGDGQFGSARNLDPSTEILTLADYRMRHSHYKLDEDLIRLHQQYPFITIWDDHETANDSWYGGAQNHTTASEGDWFSRKTAGIRSYMEWMPLRMPDVMDSSRIFRRFDFGDLMTLHMLDTRLYAREEQSTTTNNSSTRTLLGQTQYNWLTQGILNSPAKWQVLGNQVMMAPLRVLGQAVNQDQWDGYPAERTRFWDFTRTNNLRNLVVLTGDIHTSWANDLPGTNYNATTGANSVGVEFVVTSITSTSFNLPIPPALLQIQNRHMKFIEITKRGYLILDINRQRTQGEWYYLSTVDTRNATETLATKWFTNDNTRYLSSAPNASTPRSSIFTLQAPLQPRVITSAINNIDLRQATLLGAHPNPFSQQLDIQYFLKENTSGTLKMELVDLLGRVIQEKQIENPSTGLQYEYWPTGHLNPGTYFLRISMNGKAQAMKVMKVN